MPTFITPYTFDPAKFAGEVNKEPSLTVPDMSFSIQELLERFTTMPEIIKQGFFEENPDFDDALPVDVDLVDIQENELYTESLKQSARQQIKDLNERKAEQSGAISE